MPEPRKRQQHPKETGLDPKKQREQRMQRITTYTGIVVLVLIAVIVGYLLLANRQPVASQNPQAADFHFEKQPSLGDPSAHVKVVEFGDFKCPACKIFEEEVFPQFKEDFIDMGKVEFFFLNYQFLAEDSTTAGIAGECLFHQNEAAFWAYYRAIYQNQGPETQAWATRDTLLSLVQEHVQGLAEVSLTALAQCIANGDYKKDVEEDKQLGIAAGVNSTPSLLVNGRKVENWYPYASFKAAIEKALQTSTP